MKTPIHDCTACDGAGGLRVEEPGEPSGWWTCESCEGSGRTTSCADCMDPIALPLADRQWGRCDVCLDAENRASREAALQRRFA